MKPTVPTNVPLDPGPLSDRPLDPETEAAMPAGPIPLLQRYETIVGAKLKKLPEKEALPLARTGAPWCWSWTPEQCAMFLSDWESQIYMASPLLRDLATTRDPMGGGFMFERFCKPPIVEAIRKVQIMYDKPLGKVQTIPKGTFSVDLRPAPPGMRPTIFHINDLAFWGHVTNIPEKLRDQLAYMHGRWYQNGMDQNNPKDNPTIDLGAANAPGGGGR